MAARAVFSNDVPFSNRHPHHSRKESRPMHFDTKKLTRCALIAASLRRADDALQRPEPCLRPHPAPLFRGDDGPAVPDARGELGPFHRLRALQRFESLRPARHDRRLGGHAARSAPHRPLPQEVDGGAAARALQRHPHRRADRLGGSRRRQRLPARVLL